MRILKRFCAYFKKFKNKEDPATEHTPYDVVKDKKILADEVCNLNTTCFKSIVGKVAFVDKTMLIYDFLSMEGPMWVTAPPHFGKTTNMDMMKAFLTIEIDNHGEQLLWRECGENYRFFQKHSFKICTLAPKIFDAHCGRYPVIHIDLAKVRGSCKSDVFVCLKHVVCDAYRQFSFLVRQTEDGKWVWNTRKLLRSTFPVERFISNLDCTAIGPLKENSYGLHDWEFLCRLLEYNYYKTAIVLIDNCDLPILNALADPDTRNEEFIKWLDKTMGELIDFLVIQSRKRALLNRTVPLFVPGHHYFSHWHDVSERIEYNRWCGFTIADVLAMCDNPIFSVLKTINIRQWYGKYKVYYDYLHEEIDTYNSWSLLNCFHKSIIDGEANINLYWPDNRCLLNLENLFRKNIIREKIRDIVYEKYELLKIFEFEKYEVDVFKLIELINLSISDNDPMTIEFNDEGVGENNYLLLNLFFYMHYLGYLNKAVLGVQSRRVCFYAPNSEMTNKLMMKLLPHIYSKITEYFDLDTLDIWG